MYFKLNVAKNGNSHVLLVLLFRFIRPTSRHHCGALSVDVTVTCSQVLLSFNSNHLVSCSRSIIDYRVTFDLLLIFRHANNWFSPIGNTNKCTWARRNLNACALCSIAQPWFVSNAPQIRSNWHESEEFTPQCESDILCFTQFIREYTIHFLFPTLWQLRIFEF